MELACDSAVLTEYPEHPLKLTELTLSKTYHPLGFPLEVLTNSRVILEMNDKLWGHFTHQHDTAPMRSYVHVTPGGPPECPPALTYQYVAPHFVDIADPQHYAVIDLAHGETVISITEASLRHRLYIEYFFLGAPLTTIPAKAIHAACVAWNGRGILLCGDSGAGKSTLAYGCARSGWEYISDDGSFVLDEEIESSRETLTLSGSVHLLQSCFRRFRGWIRHRAQQGNRLSRSRRIVSLGSCAGSGSALTSLSFLTGIRIARTTRALSHRRCEVIHARRGIRQNEIRDRQFAAVERLLAADVFELQYSDLESAIERLRRLVEDGR